MLDKPDGPPADARSTAVEPPITPPAGRPTGEEMVARVLALTALGLSAFPIKEGAKAPVITGWQTLSTTDPDEIRRLWTQGFWRACFRRRDIDRVQADLLRAKTIEAARSAPLGEPAPFNIGIDTGRLLPNGNHILAVDLDTKGKEAKGRQPGYPAATANERYASLVTAIGEPLPKTLTSRTASRGLHLIFQYSGDLEIASDQKLIDGVDTRACGGYIAAPGSYSEEWAGYYGWEPGRGPGEIEIAHAPEPLLRFCKAGPVRSAADRTTKPPACELDTPANVAHARQWLRDEAPEAVEGDGGRQELKRVVQRLGDFGLSADGAFDVLTEDGGWNDTKAAPPFDASADDADGMRRMIDDLFAYHRERPLGCDAPHDVRDTFEPVEGVDGPAEAARSSPRVLFGPDLAEDMRTTKYEPLVAGLIDKKTFALILGEPKQGKTHIALSMFGAVAQGAPWGGRATSQGLVCYFAGEGGDDVKRRALAITGGRPPSEFPFALIPARFNVVTPAGVDQILKRIDEAAKISGFDPAAIVLDTLSRGFGGLNENESAAMGLFIEGVDKIRASTGANVTVLHHLGKNTANGARGHSSLRGAYDTALEVSGGKVTVIEQRALRPAPPVAFQIRTQRVGPDSEGCMVETAVAEIHATAFTEPVALSTAVQRALDVFDALAAESVTGVVTGAAWNARLKLARGADGKGAPKATLSGWRKALIEAALIEACGDDLWKRI